MAKMVNLDKLKPLIEPLLNDDNSTATLEGIMAIAEDFDEEAINKRTEEAVNSAKEEAKKEYSQKLHEMFFGGVSTPEGQVDDQNTDPEINSGDHSEVGYDSLFTSNKDKKGE